MTRFAILAALVLGSGCSVAVRNTNEVERTVPRDVHWARASAEHRAVYVQTYRMASDRLRELAAGQPTGWAVILDADETVLDNSEYQRRIGLRGESFDPATWDTWVREVAADSLPGAAGFIALTRSLGGRVVIVTNRDDDQCDPTRENFRKLGIVVDAVLCQAPGEVGKNTRFRAVATGVQPSPLPPLRVLMFIGDNIQDFPDTTQQIRDAAPSAYDRFGRDWFVLPNPMYGSWERVQAR